MPSTPETPSPTPPGSRRYRWRIHRLIPPIIAMLIPGLNPDSRDAQLTPPPTRRPERDLPPLQLDQLPEDMD